MKIRRLEPGERDLARTLFATMAESFEEAHEVLGDAYLDRLLGRTDFLAFAALQGDEVVGGLTAHLLPMTKSEIPEIFLYDIAVRPDRRRTGVGRMLVTALREVAERAGIQDIFVPADNEDGHALDFYRALGGEAAPVTIFTFRSGC